jgi:hypothetical protein
MTTSTRPTKMRRLRPNADREAAISALEDSGVCQEGLDWVMSDFTDSSTALDIWRGTRNPFWMNFFLNMLGNENAEAVQLLIGPPTDKDAFRAKHPKPRVQARWDALCLRIRRLVPNPFLVSVSG